MYGIRNYHGSAGSIKFYIGYFKICLVFGIISYFNIWISDLLGIWFSEGTQSQTDVWNLEFSIVGWAQPANLLSPSRLQACPVL